MALAITWFMSPREAGRAEDIRAAGGLVLISRTRVAEPAPVLAATKKCGCAVS
jgi:hypothetical protein